MKIRADFVTNSSSSSFTIISLHSDLVDEWMEKNPVTCDVGPSDRDDNQYTSFDDLGSSFAAYLDEDGSEMELLEGKGFVDNLIYILSGGQDGEDDDLEPAEELVPLIKFLKKHKKEIEAEAEGEIVSATQFECDAPRIETIKLSGGKSRYADVDLELIEPEGDDAEMMDELYEWDEDYVQYLLDKYGSCAGYTFAITGKLNHFANRDEPVEYIENRGGRVASSVNAKTDYLINNDSESTSSKNKKAKELGVAIITEDEFWEKFGFGDIDACMDADEEDEWDED